MTATTPENGLRTRLHRLARGSVISAIVLGLAGAGAGSAFAATDAESEGSSIDLLVSAGVRGTVAPGAATTASITVQNDSRTELSSGRVTVELNRTPSPTRPPSRHGSTRQTPRAASNCSALRRLRPSTPRDP